MFKGFSFKSCLAKIFWGHSLAYCFGLWQ